jgi:hypothetical protein
MVYGVQRKTAGFDSWPLWSMTQRKIEIDKQGLQSQFIILHSELFSELLVSNWFIQPPLCGISTIFSERLIMGTITCLNRRKAQRTESKNGITLTPNGICKLINLSNEGVSFKCVDGPDIPAEWSMSIYDVTGQGMERLQVNKVWEKRLNNPRTTSLFSVEVGGVFKNLSSSQKAQIIAYLRELSKCQANNN